MEGHLKKQRVGWDRYFLGLAFVASFRSEDPDTKHGCVLVDERKRVIATGFNGLIRGLPAEEEFITRPGKYDFMIHSEENAILNSMIPAPGYGITAYITGSPCSNCFQRMIQFGVDRMVIARRKGWVRDEHSHKIKEKIWHHIHGLELTFLEIDFDWIVEGFDRVKEK